MLKESFHQLYKSLVECDIKPLDYAALVSDLFHFDFSDQYSLTVETGAQKIVLSNNEKIELRPEHILSAILKYEKKIWIYDDLSQWAFIVFAQRDFADFDRGKLSEEQYDELIDILNQLSLCVYSSQGEQEELVKMATSNLGKYL